MQFLINQFQLFMDHVQFAWEFFCSFIKNTIGLLRYLTVIQELSQQVIMSLPGWMQPFLVITLTVSILYIILGTNSGGRG